MPTEHQVCVSYLCNFAPVQIRVSVVVRCVWSGNHRWRLRCGPRLSDAAHLIGSIFGTGGKVIHIIICCSHSHVAANCQSVPSQRIRTLKTYSRWRFAMSGVAQWLACWAHNPKVRGSKPRSATFPIVAPEYAQRVRMLLHSSTFSILPACNCMGMVVYECYLAKLPKHSATRKSTGDHLMTDHFLVSSNYLPSDFK